jgi:hypothetical protein
MSRWCQLPECVARFSTDTRAVARFAVAGVGGNPFLYSGSGDIESIRETWNAYADLAELEDVPEGASLEEAFHWLAMRLATSTRPPVVMHPLEAPPEELKVRLVSHARAVDPGTSRTLQRPQVAAEFEPWCVVVNLSAGAVSFLAPTGSDTAELFLTVPPFEAHLVPFAPIRVGRPSGTPETGYVGVLRYPRLTPEQARGMRLQPRRALPGLPRAPSAQLDLRQCTGRVYQVAPAKPAARAKQSKREAKEQDATQAALPLFPPAASPAAQALDEWLTAHALPCEACPLPRPVILEGVTFYAPPAHAADCGIALVGRVEVEADVPWSTCTVFVVSAAAGEGAKLDRRVRDTLFGGSVEMQLAADFLAPLLAAVEPDNVFD